VVNGSSAECGRVSSVRAVCVSLLIEQLTISALNAAKRVLL